MPTYEYRCRACGHGFDIVQSFKDEALTICPACGGELRKVYAPPAISFKGSGFYATDSRSRADAKGDGGSTEATSSTDGKGSDGKGPKEGTTSRDSKDAPESRGSSKDPKEPSAGSKRREGGSKRDGGGSTAERSPDRSSSGPKRDTPAT
jgi:putative FmdB family regulatory protein